MAAAARGRGRARISVPAAPLRKPGEAPAGVKGGEQDFDELASLFKKFSLKSSDSLLEEVSAKFELYGTSDSNIQKVIEYLCQKTLKDGEFAKPAAEIANKLISLENTGAKFRGLFLKQVQELYKTREATQEKSVDEWIGLAAFICQTFNIIRISDAPLKPLAGAAFQVLTELLAREGRTDDEVDCFNQQFRTVGKTLHSVNEAKMDELVQKIRDTLIMDEKSSPPTRCLLLEMLELYWGGWTITQETQCYYSDMLADVMAAES